MKKSFFKYSLVALLLAVVPSSVMADSLTSYVDPRIGTASNGHVFLGANVPFGFVQLGPTEPTRGWDWCSGYHDSDNVLIGFCHTHLSGTGIGELGDIGLLPVSNLHQDSIRFSHQNEEVRPGYYRVDLSDPNVRVELTATQRVGFHRYTFHQSEAYLRLNLNTGIGWDKPYATDFHQESPTTVTGLRFSTGWAKDQKVYFVAEFSQPVKLVESEKGIGIFQPSDIGHPILVKVGLSAVSIDGAKRNLTTEIPGWDFDQVRRDADKVWEQALSRIRVETGDERIRHVFYTAMYHAYFAPSVFCDVDGQYRGADGVVHQSSTTNYTTLSLWDTYRAEMPLLSIAEPQRARDMAQAFLQISEEQGRLPVWHLMGNETDCMVGNPGAIVVADYTLKGLVPDKQRALDALVATMNDSGRGLGLLNEYGYIPFDKDSTHETVAKTLEYAIAESGVEQVARQLGHSDVAQVFARRAQAYKHLFDPSTQFMRGRSSTRQWRTPFNPFHAVHRMDDYTEGNAWQYTWLVPHDIPGLVKCFPSEKAFVTKLDSLFIVEGDMGEEASPDISGLIGQYAHGNEPSHHIIYMYNYVGQPYKAAPLLRKVMREMYTDRRDGLCGNEDVGQMSAWYILSAIGLYQPNPVNGAWVIGSPVVDNAVISLENGKTFTIETEGNSDTNIYVQGATFNGRPLRRSYLTYQEIMKGGVLKLKMGNKPSKWGTSKSARPSR